MQRFPCYGKPAARLRCFKFVRTVLAQSFSRLLRAKATGQELFMHASPSFHPVSRSAYELVRLKLGSDHEDRIPGIERLLESYASDHRAFRETVPLCP